METDIYSADQLRILCLFYFTIRFLQELFKEQISNAEECSLVINN